MAASPHENRHRVCARRMCPRQCRFYKDRQLRRAGSQIRDVDCRGRQAIGAAQNPMSAGHARLAPQLLMVGIEQHQFGATIDASICHHLVHIALADTLFGIVNRGRETLPFGVANRKNFRRAVSIYRVKVVSTVEMRMPSRRHSLPEISCKAKPSNKN